MVEITKFIILAIMLSLTIFTTVSFIKQRIELEVEKKKFEDYGKTMNLLNAIATSREITIKDSYGQPMKSVLDSFSLLDLESKGKELSPSYYDYDYSLEIENFETGDKWEFGFPEDELNRFFDVGKKCGEIEKTNYLSTYSLPTAITRGGKRDPGVVRIKMAKTPLSMIAYSVIKACEREEYEKSFWVYSLKKGEDGIKIQEVNPGKYEIYVISDKGMEFHKEIPCDLVVNEKTLIECDDSCEKNGCYKLKIKREGNEVNVYVSEYF